MSCHFPIRFAPDSLRDYDDEIVIKTQSSQQMVIKVEGRREPPCLTSKLQASMLASGGVERCYSVIGVIRRNEFVMKQVVMRNGDCI